MQDQRDGVGFGLKSIDFRSILLGADDVVFDIVAGSVEAPGQGQAEPVVLDGVDSPHAQQANGRAGCRRER